MKDKKETAQKFLHALNEYNESCKVRSEKHDLLWEAMKDMRKSVTPRIYAILKMRFRNGMRLEQVAKHFDVTRERIRQLEERAMNELRAMSIE